MVIELLSDPTIWLGLFTLIVLEIVLGIDNLVFIAILADKLPPHQRDKARIIGLAFALVMRLALLSSISWMVTLTTPFITLAGLNFGGRDLIMLAGGLFLLFKATMELHERLEGHSIEHTGPRIYAGFWSVVAQIVVLDAVFSIDSVITAVGMVDHLPIMMAAVIIAIIIMMLASKPLTAFVNSHPTVIILCLGFLMMIGFSLVAEGFGFHIPKGYLYAAIGFSVLIEMFNQFARFNRKRFLVGKRPLRERTAEAVLNLLGGKAEMEQVGSDIADLVSSGNASPVFNPAEQVMIRGVLSLAERPAKSIMTPRPDVEGINIRDDEDVIKEKLRKSPYSRLVVMESGKSEPIGIIQKKDLLNMLLEGNEFSPLSVIQQPLAVPENKPVLSMLEEFRRNTGQVAFVVDEFGSFEGLVTLTDVLEAIAGDMREEHEMQDMPYIQPLGENAYLIDGRTDIEDLRQSIPIPLPEGDFHTVAGLALHALQHVPEEGESCELEGWRLEVTRMDGNRIDQIIFRLLNDG